MRTTQEQLEAIDEAIYALENTGVKSYNLGTYSVTREDLATLYAERRQLKTELAYENSNGGVFVGVFNK